MSAKRSPQPQMPEKQRLAVSLWICAKGQEPLSYATIGSLLGCSRQNANRLVRKGLAWLKANGHSPADLCGTAKAPR